MTSQWQSIAGIAVGCIIMGLGAITAADPATLGIDPILQRWLGVLLIVLGPIAVALRVSVSAALGR